MSLLIVIVLITLTLFILQKLILMKKSKKFNSIPTEKGYPLFGSITPFIWAKNFTDIANMINDASKRHQKYGICKLKVGFVTVVVLNDPKYVERVSSAIDGINKGLIYNLIFGSSLTGIFTTSDINTWKRLRKPLNKRLTKNLIMNEYHYIFIRKLKTMMQILKEKKLGSEINFMDELPLLTFDVLCETNLGVVTNDIEERKYEYVHHMRRYFDGKLSSGFWIFFSTLNAILKKNRYSQLKHELVPIKQFLSWALQERSQQSKNNDNTDAEFYTDFLLRRMKEDNVSLKDIKRELSDVITAGTETSSVVANNALVFLAIHPDIQETAFQEQVAILGYDLTKEPTQEELSSMDFLTRVVKESLRHSSPDFVVKYLDQDTELDSYVIPKGTQLLFHLRGLHTDPRYWEKPTEFYPDHFLQENEAKRPHFSYIPFGFSQRRCPGELYALHLLKMILSFILRNFKITTNMKQEDIIMDHSLIRCISNGYLKIHKRH